MAPHAWTSTVYRKYVYDGWPATRSLGVGWNLVAELDAANSVVRSYLWGTDLSGTLHGAGGVGGLLVVDDAAEEAHFVAYDGNGNVTTLIQATNSSVTAEYEYDPFGRTIRATGIMADSNPFRFSSKYHDEETDLVYYGYRYLKDGRWLNRDPIGEEGGLNLYGYVGNDPVNRVDSLGLEDLSGGPFVAVESAVPIWRGGFLGNEAGGAAGKLGANSFNHQGLEEKSLKETLITATADDVVTIIAHGVRPERFAPTIGISVDGELLHYREIAALINTHHGAPAILFVDACSSGNFAKKLAELTGTGAVVGVNVDLPFGIDVAVAEAFLNAIDPAKTPKEIVSAANKALAAANVSSKYNIYLYGGHSQSQMKRFPHILNCVIGWLIVITVICTISSLSPVAMKSEGFARMMEGGLPHPWVSMVLVKYRLWSGILLTLSCLATALGVKYPEASGGSWLLIALLAIVVGMMSSLAGIGLFDVGVMFSD